MNFAKFLRTSFYRTPLVADVSSSSFILKNSKEVSCFFIVADSLSLRKTQFVELLKLKFKLFNMSLRHSPTQTVENNGTYLSDKYFVIAI